VREQNHLAEVSGQDTKPKELTPVDTTLTPPGAKHPATRCNCGKRKGLRYAGFANPATPRNSRPLTPNEQVSGSRPLVGSLFSCSIILCMAEVSDSTRLGLTCKGILLFELQCSGYGGEVAGIQPPLILAPSRRNVVDDVSVVSGEVATQ
jgi:hypothetical protein